jgi:hypothetical protein
MTGEGLSAHLSRRLLFLQYPPFGRSPVPKPNYGFQKRQKELAKQQKREAKAQRRKERAEALPDPPPDPTLPPMDPEVDPT